MKFRNALFAAAIATGIAFHTPEINAFEKKQPIVEGVGSVKNKNYGQIRQKNGRWYAPSVKWNEIYVTCSTDKENLYFEYLLNGINNKKEVQLYIDGNILAMKCTENATVIVTDSKLIIGHGYKDAYVGNKPFNLVFHLDEGLKEGDKIIKAVISNRYAYIMTLLGKVEAILAGEKIFPMGIGKYGIVKDPKEATWELYDTGKYEILCIKDGEDYVHFIPMEQAYLMRRYPTSICKYVRNAMGNLKEDGDYVDYVNSILNEEFDNKIKLK